MGPVALRRWVVYASGVVTDPMTIDHHTLRRRVERTQDPPMDERPSPEQLGAVQRTLLVPLWARARERELLQDPVARAVLAKLDWDCSVLDRDARASQLGCVVRAAQIDQWIRSFAARHERACVVELGVGLNSRAARLALDHVAWIEADLPDVIAMRERCVPRGASERRVAIDLRNTGQIRELLGALDRPTLVVSEGVLVYLRDLEARSVLRTAFESPAVEAMVFDCMAPIVRRLQSLHDAMRHFDARFEWSVRSPRELASCAPGARVVEVASFYELLFAHARRLPAWMRLARPWVERIYPAVRGCYSVVRMERGSFLPHVDA